MSANGGNLVDNDFHSSSGIFDLFDGLQVQELDGPLESSKPTVNGLSPKPIAELNGTHKVTDNKVFEEVLN